MERPTYPVPATAIFIVMYYLLFALLLMTVHRRNLFFSCVLVIRGRNEWDIGVSTGATATSLITLDLRFFVETIYSKIPLHAFLRPKSPTHVNSWRDKKRASETMLVSSAGRYPSRTNDCPPFHYIWIDQQI